MKIKTIISRYGWHAAIAAAYIAAMLFILFGIGTECYFIVQHPAFLVDCEFFKEQVSELGGLGAYISLFAEQYFYTTFWGGFLVTVEIFISTFLFVKLLERISDMSVGAKSIWWIVPLFVAIVCLNNVYFSFAIIGQLIVMLTIMLILHSLKVSDTIYGVSSAASAVAVYHFCGPLYLYSFCVAEIAVNFIVKKRLGNTVWVMAVTAFYPAVMYRFFLAITPARAFYFPVPHREVLGMYQPVIALYYALVPLAVVIQHFAADRKFKRPSVMYAASVALMMAALVFTYNLENPRRERFSAKICWEGECCNWDYVIKHAMDFHSYDRNTNFYYGMALAMTGQMSYRLFEYPQLLGSEGLWIEEPIAGMVCYPSSSLYFNIGQIPNALHYAYESIVYFRDSPLVLRRIIDCLIIEGRYDEAKIFLKQLDRQMLSGSFVKDRLNYMEGKKDTKLSVEFVKEKSQLGVMHDYIMSPPYRNFEELFLAHKNNRAAVDYLLCYCLLEKDLENFFNVLVLSNYEPTNLPRHYQEAVAIYRATTKSQRDGVQAVKLDPMVSRRFAEFAQIVNRDGDRAYDVIKQKFADTYWIYYTYENPMKRNFSLRKNHPE